MSVVGAFNAIASPKSLTTFTSPPCLFLFQEALNAAVSDRLPQAVAFYNAARACAESTDFEAAHFRGSINNCPAFIVSAFAHFFLLCRCTLSRLLDLPDPVPLYAYTRVRACVCVVRSFRSGPSNLFFSPFFLLENSQTPCI